MGCRNTAGLCMSTPHVILVQHDSASHAFSPHGRLDSHVLEQRVRNFWIHQDCSLFRSHTPRACQSDNIAPMAMSYAYTISPDWSSTYAPSPV